MRRLAIAVLSVVLVGTLPAPTPAPAGPNWCRVYCDAMYIGCLKTFGLLDPDLCDEWYEGCRDGCRVRLR